jgi:hypothetical protein
MKKLILLSAITFSLGIFAQQNNSNANSNSNNFRTENVGFYNMYNSTTFENNEAIQDISKYYFEIKKYIKSKKNNLSKNDYQSLMTQNEKDFTTINKAVDNSGAKIFLNKYSEELENYKKKIISKVDLLAKN